MPLEQHPTDPDKLVFRSHLRKGSEMSSPIDLALQALEILRTEPMAKTAADKAQALLEQIEQTKPVAWMQEMPLEENEVLSVRMTSVKEVAEEWDQAIPLYTAPPPRKPWVGLTGDEVNEFAAGCHLGNSVQGAIRKAEAKLKEKNT